MKNSYKILQISFLSLLLTGMVSLGWCQPVKVAILDSGSAKYVDESLSFTSFSANKDPLNHGTIVARIIREQNPEAYIAMLQVCDYKNGKLKPSPEAIHQALQWAMQNNIDLINLSLVVKDDPEMETLITQASQQYGIIFIAAGGNKSLQDHFATNQEGYVIRGVRDPQPRFPASHPNVLSVGALDPSGNIAFYSSHHCAIYAPGAIHHQEGTSFASAVVTAAAADILSRFPSTTQKEILPRLKNYLSPVKK